MPKEALTLVFLSKFVESFHSPHFALSSVSILLLCSSCSVIFYSMFFFKSVFKKCFSYAQLGYCHLLKLHKIYKYAHLTPLAGIFF